MKRIISIFLSAFVIIAGSISVYAENEINNTSGKVPVKIQAEPSLFSVTLPVGLPVALSKDGEITTSQDVNILNNSIGPILIKQVMIAGENDWTLKEYTNNFRQEKVGSKFFGFEIFNTPSKLDGACDIEPQKIDGKSQINIPYNAKLSPQNKSTIENIAQATFIVGWDLDSGATFEPSDVDTLKVSEEKILTFRFKNIPEDKTDITWTSSNEAVATVEDYTPINTLSLIDGERQCKIITHSAGEATITGTLANGDSESINIKVKKLTGVVFNPKAEKTFKSGDTISESDIEAYSTYSDGSKDEIVNFEITQINGLTDKNSRLREGTNTIYLSYDNKLAIMNIEIEYSIPVGTKYTQGNYEYSYKQIYSVAADATKSKWITQESISYSDAEPFWGVRVLDNTQTTYAAPLTEIQGKPVNMYNNLFYYTKKTDEINLINWDTSNIVSLNRMFGFSGAKTINGLNRFDTSNVVDMSGVFDMCSAQSIDISNWNTINVKSMANMFMSSQIKELRLTNFNTSNVVSMSNMFHGSRANTIDILSFDTSNVNDMGLMFASLYGDIKTLDLSNFEFNERVNIKNMLMNSLDTIYVKSQADKELLESSITGISSTTNIVVK